jgi:hypothetical protein
MNACDECVAKRWEAVEKLGSVETWQCGQCGAVVTVHVNDPAIGADAKLLVLLESSLESVSSVDMVRSAIHMGLGWPTPYWPELAVKWLEQGAPMNLETAGLLDALAATARFPQGLRHRAFALARRFERSQSNGQS